MAWKVYKLDEMDNDTLSFVRGNMHKLIYLANEKYPRFLKWQSESDSTHPYWHTMIRDIVAEYIGDMINVAWEIKHSYIQASSLLHLNMIDKDRVASILSGRLLEYQARLDTEEESESQ